MQVYLHLLSHHLKEDKRLFLKLLNYSFNADDLQSVSSSSPVSLSLLSSRALW